MGVIAHLSFPFLLHTLLPATASGEPLNWQSVMRGGATLMHYSTMLSEASQETQMGISHKGSEARLLTKQGRQQGHQGPWYHTSIQMVTEGPISYCPVTKEVPRSLTPPPPPPSFPLVPPPSPPSSQEKERKQKVLGLHHCLHHCDNLHIYLVIFSLFLHAVAINLSGLGLCSWDMQSSAGRYFRNDIFFNRVIFLLCKKSPGKLKAQRELLQSGHSVCLLSAVTCSGLSWWELTLWKGTRWDGDAGRPHPERKAGVELSLDSSTCCSHSPWTSLTNGGQDKTGGVTWRPCATRPEYWLRSYGAKLIDEWCLLWLMLSSPSPL